VVYTLALLSRMHFVNHLLHVVARRYRLSYFILLIMSIVPAVGE